MKWRPWFRAIHRDLGYVAVALTLAGDFLYVTGGGYMGPGLDTVFAARVRF